MGQEGHHLQLSALPSEFPLCSLCPPGLCHKASGLGLTWLGQLLCRAGVKPPSFLGGPPQAALPPSLTAEAAASAFPPPPPWGCVGLRLLNPYVRAAGAFLPVFDSGTTQSND